MVWRRVLGGSTRRVGGRWWYRRRVGGRWWYGGGYLEEVQGG